MNKNHHSRTEARSKFSENKTASDYGRNRKPRGSFSRGAEESACFLGKDRHENRLRSASDSRSARSRDTRTKRAWWREGRAMSNESP